MFTQWSFYQQFVPPGTNIKLLQTTLTPTFAAPLAQHTFSCRINPSWTPLLATNPLNFPILRKPFSNLSFLNTRSTLPSVTQTTNPIQRIWKTGGSIKRAFLCKMLASRILSGSVQSNRRSGKRFVPFFFFFFLAIFLLYFNRQQSSNGDIYRPFDDSISTTTTTNSSQLLAALLQRFPLHQTPLHPTPLLLRHKPTKPFKMSFVVPSSPF